MVFVRSTEGREPLPLPQSSPIPSSPGTAAASPALQDAAARSSSRSVAARFLQPFLPTKLNRAVPPLPPNARCPNRARRIARTVPAKPQAPSAANFAPPGNAWAGELPPAVAAVRLPLLRQSTTPASALPALDIEAVPTTWLPANSCVRCRCRDAVPLSSSTRACHSLPVPPQCCRPLRSHCPVLALQVSAAAR